MKKEDSSYPKPEHTRLADDLFKFNYHISVIFSESDSKFYWKRSEFFLKIHDKTLLSGYSIIVSNREIKKESGIWEMKQPRKSFLNRKNSDLNQLLDHDERDDPMQFSVEEKHSPGSSGVFTKNYSDGMKYIYMQTGKDGTPQNNVSTYFKIAGINQSMTNLYLKIFTSPLVGNSVLLFSSHIINISSNGEGETEGVFTPVNDLNDGFCIFELWNGNVFLSDNTNSHLVLEKLKTGSFTNSTMPNTIHFAYSFFNPKSSAKADQYIGKVENALNGAWDQQVGTWNFCSPYTNLVTISDTTD